MYPSTSCVCNNTRTGIQPTHTHTEKERERGKKGADRMVSIMELFSPSFGWRTENQTRHGTHKRQHLTCWRRLSHTRSFFFYSLVAVLLALDLFRLPDSFSSPFFSSFLFYTCIYTFSFFYLLHADKFLPAPISTPRSTADVHSSPYYCSFLSFSRSNTCDDTTGYNIFSIQRVHKAFLQTALVYLLVYNNCAWLYRKYRRGHYIYHYKLLRCAL